MLCILCKMYSNACHDRCPTSNCPHKSPSILFLVLRRVWQLLCQLVCDSSLLAIWLSICHFAESLSMSTATISSFNFSSHSLFLSYTNSFSLPFSLSLCVGICVYVCVSALTNLCVLVSVCQFVDRFVCRYVGHLLVNAPFMLYTGILSIKLPMYNIYPEIDYIYSMAVFASVYICLYI